MSLRLNSLLPRVFVIVIVALLATATITFAAETTGTPQVQPPAETTAPKILLVPDVRGQAYVFAKSTLEEGGFAWHVAGGAPGYAANTVRGQSPAPGTRVYDTGAPTISLTLRMNPRYPQAGTPESNSPFSGTPLKFVGVTTRPKPKPKAKAKAKVKVKAKAKHVAKPTPKKHSAKPKPKPAKPKPHPASTRPAAFVVPGAKAEPLDEIPLPERATNLDHWLSSHPSPTNDNVSHWLYQHAWIVTGAKLGWWHGAQALETLIAVDQKVERQWKLGHKSEQVARAALAEVRSKSK
jgi:beta-lactam-binding protein with PASTA domain